jgi:hypothetical protein
MITFNIQVVTPSVTQPFHYTIEPLPEMRLTVVTELYSKMAMNPNLSSSPACYELVYIHGVLNTRTILLKDL